MMHVAIVILNWNGKEMLRKYLPSVISNSQIDGVNIIVADNGSSDGSIDMLKAEFPNVGIIAFDNNYGFAEGYNKALAEIEADYYLLLNSDVEIRQKNWLQPMIEYMDAHHECAACQPKLLSLLHPDEFEYAGAAGGFIDMFGYPYCRGRVFNKVEKDLGQYNNIVSLLWATGAALFVRAEDFWFAGGLDGRFFAHMEEIDLCWRMRSLGKRIVCIPESTAYHLGGATLNQGNPRKTFLNFRNNMLMLYKNLTKRQIWWILPLRFILDFVAAMKFLISGDTPNFKAVLKADKEFIRLCPEFSEDRKLNLDRRVLNHIPEHTNRLILIK
ncbi:MAG: glycosyltransferase family 2 protein [Bacteroidaceae bacterium]|nr:glycosyltransferase family 2 protein [Bacteroidaceae bacterium]